MWFGGCPEKRLTSSAEGYLNRYRNGWGASAVATKAWVDETIRRRGKPVGGQPAIPVGDLPVPVPISRFLWPFVSFSCLPTLFKAPSVNMQSISGEYERPEEYCWVDKGSIVRRCKK